MSDEERKALLARMQAKLNETKTMTREEARKRLAEEERRVKKSLKQVFGATTVRS